MRMPSLIIQVFTNLLDNIVKYTPAGTHILVAAAVDQAPAGQSVPRMCASRRR